MEAFGEALGNTLSNDKNGGGHQPTPSLPEKAVLEDLRSRNTGSRNEESAEKEEDGSSQRGDSDLYLEVGELAQYLNGMVGKLSSAGSLMESLSSELPFGTDELTEVGRKTEEATQKILDDSDRVIDNHELMSARLDSLKSALLGEPIQAEGRIKEDIETLCQLLEENKATMFNLVGTLSFQDPAGQQLRKVTNMLKMLQSRILKMVVGFGQSAGGTHVEQQRQKELMTELEYSSDGEALEQDLVDSVLKEYGF